jgi:hypothetical protein
MDLRIPSYACVPAIMMAALAVGGCSSLRKPLPPRLESVIHSPYAGVQTLAIAPTINLSGSRDFDPLAVSDAIYAELQQVPGLNVIPLNRVLLAMRQLNIRAIDDPVQAQRIAENLGANGLVVPAVTAFNPYNPPAVGMILQIYTPRSANGGGGTGGGVQKQPASQANGVFNATNQSVLRELSDFARGRTQYDSALHEQKYLMDSDLYLRFVSHAMVRRLMEVERARATDR